jgi:hypothetical protein
LTWTFRRGNLAAMQTLGLSGESQHSDGPLKSIFWPAVENAWDVDYLGRQGYLICALIAFVQLIVAVLSGNPTTMVFGVVEAVVFLVGGMGVREANWPTAALVFSIYFAGILCTMATGKLPGILAVLFAGVLLSNVRAAFLASEWRPAGEDEDRPTRFNDTVSDILADQLPAKAWPVLQVPFYGLATLALAANLAVLGFQLLHRFGILSQAGPVQP